MAVHNDTFCKWLEMTTLGSSLATHSNAVRTSYEFINFMFLLLDELDKNFPMESASLMEAKKKQTYFKEGSSLDSRKL